MDFFSGVAGFFLSMGNLFTPASPGDLSISVLSRTGDSYRIESHLKFDLTDDAAALVDAGVPLQVRYVCRTENETTVMVRTLRSDLSNNCYTVTDSTGKRNISVKKHSNVLVAARQFKAIAWSVDAAAERVEFDAEILAVNVPRLGRTVDISPLFGGKKFSQTVVIDRKDFK